MSAWYRSLLPTKTSFRSLQRQVSDPSPEIGERFILSRAKNVGLKHVSGDVVEFPDDDCQFPPDLLDRVAQFFNEHPEIDGLTGRSVDKYGKTNMGHFDTKPGTIDNLNVWRRGVAYGIAALKSVFLGTPLVPEIPG